MNRRDRVINALNHRESDIIPYFAEFTGQEHARIAAYLMDDRFEDRYGMHIRYTQYWGWPAEIEDRPGYFLDAYGVVWNRSGADKDIGVVDAPLIPDIAGRTYRLPPVDEKRLRREYDAFMRQKDDRFTILGFGFTVFERAWSLCGMPAVLMAMADGEPALVGLLEEILAYNLELIHVALDYDIDGVYFGDDWGQQRGLIMGPRYWRQYIKPVVARMYAEVKKAGKYVIQHSCGDVSEILPDLIDIGLDCYQTFQPEIYDIHSFKKEYGQSLSVWGGISTQQLLPRATPDEVVRETVRIMRVMGKGGGYIAAPTHAVPQDVPPENILAMLDVFENQGRYFE